MKESSTEFGLRLWYLLKQNNVSAVALSSKLNFGQNMISNYKRGICEPTLSKLVKIADYFNVSLDWLVGREDFDNEKGLEK